MYNNYKHCTKLQIRFKDIDRQGHVNNANHLTYFETARVDYFKEVLKDRIDWITTGMILAHTEIDYKLPILLEDEVYCYTKVVRLGTKSFDIANIITKKQNGVEQECAIGKSVMVCMNYKLNTTIELPSTWRQAIETFETNLIN